MALELKDDGDITTVTDAELVDGGDKETVYQVRHITLDKNREIVKRHTTKVPNRRTHQKDEVIDWEAVNDDLFDFALVEWVGVVSKGEPVPCVAEHKKRLDAVRRAAILERAGMNEVAAAPERREQSFREVADVRGVLGA